MARKSWIQKEKKKEKLEQKYHLIRGSSKKKISKTKLINKRWNNKTHVKLQSLPRNSAPTRLRRRCFETGRARANYRDFGLSRHKLKEMFNECLLPGVTISSW
uniref:Small ribosomal subunit protein uS14c n=1 Tax=Monotropa uniflora TaxID=50148 RepID=A0A894K0T0_MONUN|nr:ribosomal protein S14 [Monotropa uniflora]